MSLLEITNLTHTFGDTVLYKNAEFMLNKGEHVGIVGENGKGKSTFIKICTGQLLPDEGSVLWQKSISIGYLDQYAQINQNQTMKEFLKTAFIRLYAIEANMIKIYETLQNMDEMQSIKKLNEAARYQEQLEQKEFYQIDTKIEQVSTGLGLTAIGLNRPIAKMSGGQRMKVILAKLLLEKPDVLLLDEPTNFLDKEHINWLLEYLKGLEQAFMVVSHDSAFLNGISSHICDIDQYALKKYVGSYYEFRRKKTALYEDYVRQYVTQQKEMKKTEEFIRKNIAGRKSKMAKGRQKQLDRMDKMQALDLKSVRPVFQFKEVPMTNTKHLEVKHLTIGYDTPLLSDLNFVVHGGEKVVISGFNGVGKTTLLKTLLGEIQAMEGKFTFSNQVVASYYEQEFSWEQGKSTPFEIVSGKNPILTKKQVYQHLASCGILQKHVDQPIESLSGGEQVKVKMCLLTLQACNFLIMDEPTNHLDVNAKKSLKDALMNFRGTVLFVSHEEVFYKEWANRVILVGKR